MTTVNNNVPNASNANDRLLRTKSLRKAELSKIAGTRASRTAA